MNKAAYLEARYVWRDADVEVTSPAGPRTSVAEVLDELGFRYAPGQPHVPRAAVAAVLEGLGFRHLPGLHDQSTHGRPGAAAFVKKLAKAVTLQDALDAAPAALRRAPGGHHGDYEGEGWERAPVGVGAVRALSEYEGVEYIDINEYLRHGPREVRPKNPADPYDPAMFDEEFNESNAARVAEIDKTMAASPLAEDVVVERIVRFGASVFGDEAYYGELNLKNTDDFDEQDALYDRWVAGERPSLEGMSWTERGYSSTTADPKVAEDFGGRWRSANSPGEGEPIIFRMLVPKGTGAVQLAEMGHAAELLLEHDLTMTVVADHGVDTDGYRRLDIEVSKP